MISVRVSQTVGDSVCDNLLSAHGHAVEQTMGHDYSQTDRNYGTMVDHWARGHAAAHALQPKYVQLDTLSKVGVHGNSLRTLQYLLSSVTISFKSRARRAVKLLDQIQSLFDQMSSMCSRPVGTHMVEEVQKG